MVSKLLVLRNDPVPVGSFSGISVLSSLELLLLLLLELLIDPVSLSSASWISELSFSELPSLLL
jgi:hypothetical protein